MRIVVDGRHNDDSSADRSGKAWLKWVIDVVRLLRPTIDDNMISITVSYRTDIPKLDLVGQSSSCLLQVVTQESEQREVRHHIWRLILSA